MCWPFTPTTYSNIALTIEIDWIWGQNSRSGAGLNGLTHVNMGYVDWIRFLLIISGGED